MADLSEDEELLAELGVELPTQKKAGRTPREERIIAGFEDIQRFVEAHGRAPQHGEGRDIFERLYAVRLDRMRDSEECRALLALVDRQGLLDQAPAVTEHLGDDLNDEALLAELGVKPAMEDDLTILKHVRSRAEIKAAEEIANRTRCADFDSFKPLFAQVQRDLEAGIRRTRPFELKSEIEAGRYFIVGGQKAFVAEKGEVFTNDQGRVDARLRVIFDNGTESRLLMRSLQRALHKDEVGRRITDPSAGPLFGDDASEDDLESGTIYVLRSKSDHPTVAANRDVIHKIGVTGGDVAARIAGAKTDPTFLFADAEVVATYELFNVNRAKLEALIHNFFSAARLDLEMNDRFGAPFKPREWFLVPLFAINEAVERIRNGSITEFRYDVSGARVVARK
jgi:T5orf172 domain